MDYLYFCEINLYLAQTLTFLTKLVKVNNLYISYFMKIYLAKTSCGKMVSLAFPGFRHFWFEAGSAKRM